MALLLITPPASEPVSLGEAKRHLRIVDFYDDDNLIIGLIKTARQVAEEFTRLAFVSQTYDFYIDHFANEIELPKPPVSIINSVTYTDENNVSQTLTSSIYELNTIDRPNKMLLAYDQSWPTTLARKNVVKINFTAGYVDNTTGLLPQTIKQAILLMVEHLYENTGVVAPIDLKSVPHAFESLLAPYRMIHL